MGNDAIDSARQNRMTCANARAGERRAGPRFVKQALMFGAASLLCAATPAALADDVESFYRGKTMDMIVGSTAGNDFDIRGRLLARHMGAHIPGNPAFVTRNMPGGGGAVALNHLYNRVARDGLTLHMILPNMGVNQAVGATGVQYDLREVRFVGNTTDSPNVMSSWAESGFLTIEDVKKKEMILGATPGNSGIYYALALNSMIGTKFRIVSGYPGGAQVNVAMERGEVHGRASLTLASWQAVKPDWLAQGKIVHLLQAARAPHPDLKGVPLLHELAPTPEDRKLLEFLSANVSIGRAVVTTPGVPAARLEALRRAFDRAIKDEKLLAEADKMQIDISPVGGEESQRISDSIVNADPAIIARAKDIMERGRK